jgi:hypothetical protein
MAGATQDTAGQYKDRQGAVAGGHEMVQWTISSAERREPKRAAVPGGVSRPRWLGWRRTRWFRSGTILLALAVSACGTFTPVSETANVVAPREDCSVSEAIPATLEDFISHPNRLLDKCIHVHGFVAYRSVVPNIQWLYERSKPEDRVALYGKDPPGKELWAINRNYADLVGFAYSCEQLGAFTQAEADRAEEEAKKNGSDTVIISMLTGNCHYHGGPLLWVSQITLDQNSPTRLFGPVAAKLGNLIPMLPSAPNAAERTNAIAPIFEFFRKQDKEGLQAHLEKLEDASAGAFANDVGDPQGPFSFLRGEAKVPDVHYFIPRDSTDSAADYYYAIGCICKTDGCDGKWPIAEMDTDNEPEWPYACIRVMKADNNKLVPQW